MSDGGEYLCATCKTSFATDSDRAQHRKAAHGQGAPPPAKVSTADELHDRRVPAMFMAPKFRPYAFLGCGSPDEISEFGPMYPRVGADRYPVLVAGESDVLRFSSSGLRLETTRWKPTKIDKQPLLEVSGSVHGVVTSSRLIIALAFSDLKKKGLAGRVMLAADKEFRAAMYVGQVPWRSVQVSQVSGKRVGVTFLFENGPTLRTFHVVLDLFSEATAQEVGRCIVIQVVRRWAEDVGAGSQVHAAVADAADSGDVSFTTFPYIRPVGSGVMRTPKLDDSAVMAGVEPDTGL